MYPAPSEGESATPSAARPAGERGSPLSSLRSPLLASIQKNKEAKRRLHSRLCRLGVFLRILTLLNGLALLAASGYSFYIFGLRDMFDEKLDLEARARQAVEYVLMAGSGLFLLCLEQGAASNEAATRASFGLAFSGGGRLALLLCLGLISAPAIRTERSLLELYATGGAVAFLVASALLQAWFLSCAPDFRKFVVAELEQPKIQVDSSAFPQIYQRDEGTHIHLGVLLPGFASRESCTLAANCSEIKLVGDIAHLEAPYSPVDSNNSVAGPFGAFERPVTLAHPVDITVPVESRMGLGILEFRFAKGLVSPVEA